MQKGIIEDWQGRRLLRVGQGARKTTGEVAK